MEIHFKSSHTKDVEDEITSDVTAHAERKIVLLKKYLRKKDGITQVYVEFGKVSESHQSGNIWRTQINLDSNGKRYHADATGGQIKAAVDKAVSEIEVELRRAKQRDENMLRRGGLAVKSFMRGFQ